MDTRPERTTSGFLVQTDLDSPILASVGQFWVITVCQLPAPQNPRLQASPPDWRGPWQDHQWLPGSSMGPFWPLHNVSLKHSALWDVSIFLQRFRAWSSWMPCLAGFPLLLWPYLIHGLCFHYPFISLFWGERCRAASEPFFSHFWRHVHFCSFNYCLIAYDYYFSVQSFRFAYLKPSRILCWESPPTSRTWQAHNGTLSLLLLSITMGGIIIHQVPKVTN